MTMNEHVKTCYTISKDHGWHDEPTTFAHDCGMIMSELGEAIQSDRHGEPPVWYRCNHIPSASHGDACVQDECLEYREGYCHCTHADRKMEGSTAELIDVAIRLFDVLGARGADVETLMSEKCEENRLRPYRHNRKY